MTFRGGDEGVDVIHAVVDRGIDVLLGAAGQPAYLGLQPQGADLADGLLLALGGAGEARLNDVHAEIVQQLRYPDLVVHGKGDAGGLLPIPQGGIQYLHPIGGGGVQGQAVEVTGEYTVRLMPATGAGVLTARRSKFGHDNQLSHPRLQR
jgi:hypothetical protein